MSNIVRVDDELSVELISFFFIFLFKVQTRLSSEMTFALFLCRCQSQEYISH